MAEQWTLIRGEAVFNADGSITVKPPDAEPSMRSVLLYNVLPPEPNYDISCKVRVEGIVGTEDRPEAQLIIHFTGTVDSRNYYFAGLGSYGFRGGIGIIVNNVATKLVDSSAVSDPTDNYVDSLRYTDYDIKVTVRGTVISVYINGVFMCAVDDAQLTLGQVGISTIYSNTTFWNFKMGLPAPCFIATAAYGSPLAPQLNVLRSFRDRCLPNKVVKGYYQVSPPIATFISKHLNMRRLVRLMLKPIIKILS